MTTARTSSILLVPLDGGVTEFRITPPRKRSIICNDGEIASLNFPWMAWGKHTRHSNPKYAHALALCAPEPITEETRLYVPNLESVFHESICFGDAEGLLTKDSDIEELFFQTSFPEQTWDLTENMLLMSVAEPWAWQFHSIDVYSRLPNMLDPTSLRFRDNTLATRPEVRWYREWLRLRATERALRQVLEDD